MWGGEGGRGQDLPLHLAAAAAAGSKSQPGRERERESAAGHLLESRTSICISRTSVDTAAVECIFDKEHLLVPIRRTQVDQVAVLELFDQRGWFPLRFSSRRREDEIAGAHWSTVTTGPLVYWSNVTY